MIRAAARRANWKPDKRAGFGHGVGFARYKNTGAYCAVIAEIEGAEDIAVKRLTIAVDVGEAINPDGVINQIEGGAIQATSWVLKERVRFDDERITSNSWTDYPILRFSEVPEVVVELIRGRISIRSAPAKRPRPGHGGDRQRRVRCARGTRPQPADHPRPPDRGHGIERMNEPATFSAAARPGPGREPCAKIQDDDRVRYRRRVRRGRRHGRKLRKGTPDRHRHPDGQRSSPDLAEENLVVPASIADVGLVETALAVRTGDPIVTCSGCSKPAGMRFSRPTRSSFPTSRHRPPEFTSRRCWQQLGIAEAVRPGSRSIRTAPPRCAIWPPPTLESRSAARSRPRSSARRAWSCRDRCRRDASLPPCIRRQ